MPQRRLTADKVYAEREDEIHDPHGKSVRLTADTRTPRDTDNPNQASVKGKPPRPHLHPQKPKFPPPRFPTVSRTTSVAQEDSQPDRSSRESSAEVSEPTEAKESSEVKETKSERKKQKKAVAKEEKRKRRSSGTVSETVPTAKKASKPKKPAADRPSNSNSKVGGASLTRFRPEDKLKLAEEGRSIFAGLPRGSKSALLAESPRAQVKMGKGL